MDRDQINDQTGEYGAGVDWDTGADVGDTGTPAIDKEATERRVNEELQQKGEAGE
jgi:hypothetical protein